MNLRTHTHLLVFLLSSFYITPAQAAITGSIQNNTDNNPNAPVLNGNNVTINGDITGGSVDATTVNTSGDIESGGKIISTDDIIGFKDLTVTGSVNSNRVDTGSLKTTGNMTVGGNLSTDGQISAKGNIKSDGNITSGTGNIGTASGDVYTGSGQIKAGFIILDGPSNEIRGVSTLKTQDIKATGNIEAGAITLNGQNNSITGVSTLNTTDKITSGADIEATGNIYTTNGNLSTSTGDIATTTGNVKAGNIALNGQNNAITGVSTLDTTGKIASGGDIQAAGNIYTTNGNLSTSTGNITTTTGNIEAGNITLNGQDNSVKGVSTINTTGKITSGGDIEATGNIYTTNGNVSTNTGNISTTTGNITAGAVTINGQDNSIHGVSHLSANTIYATGPIQAGSFYTAGNITAGKVTINGATGRISGVAPGVAANDAVNLQQLNDATKTVSRGIASLMAASNLPSVSPGKTIGIGVGLGSYNGQAGFAVGVSVRAGDSGAAKFSIATGDDGKLLLGAGAGWSW